MLKLSFVPINFYSRWKLYRGSSRCPWGKKALTFSLNSNPFNTDTHYINTDNTFFLPNQHIFIESQGVILRFPF